jgi:phage virion morphogenesis protein
MRLSITVSSLEEIVQKLNGPNMEEAVRESVTEATALLLNRTRKRFLDQVSPDGSHWEPSYAAFKRSFMGRGGGALFDTGNLFHSIQLHSVSPTEGAISTDVPYAKYHQFGIGQEKREFLGFSAEDETLALNVFLKKIKEALES